MPREAGIVAARVAPGARSLNGHRVADIDETGVTLALDAFRALREDVPASFEDVHEVVVALDEDEARDVERILRVVMDQDGLVVERFPDTPEGGQAALRGALDGAHARSRLLISAHGTTRTHPRQAPRSEGDAAAGVAILVGSQAVAHATGGPVAPDPEPGWGELGAAGPLCALLAVTADAAPGTERAGWRVEDRPRWSSPRALLSSGGAPVPAATAAKIRDAWADAAHREPRGAYVPLSAFEHHGAARYRNEGQRCTECGRVLFPPRERCPCGSGSLVAYPLSGRGRVYALTRIGAGGAPSEFAPQAEAVGGYRVAIVALEEGPRVAAMLTGADSPDVAVDDEVRLVTRLLYVQEGVPRYSFKAIRTA